MPIRITGMNSGLDTEAIITELASAKEYKKTQLEKEQKRLEWKQEAWKNLNTKIYNLYTKTLSNLRFDSAYQKNITTCSDENAASIVASGTAPKSTQTLSITNLAKAAYMTGTELGDGTKGYTKDTKLSELGITADTSIEVTIGGEKKPLELKADSTISDFTKQMKKLGLTANFDEANQRIYVSAKDTGEDYNFEFSGDEEALKALGLSESNGAKKIDGENAQIVLNGVTYISNDNVFEINGLTITAQKETESETTITTKTDTSGIYDTIKNFIKSYSELINEMDKLYNADAAKGYDPLSDDEKEAMSETEIEKWEEKIKDSLLRRDSTLSSVSSAMKSVMSAGVTMSDGTKMYLFDFGIETLGYFNAPDNEKNAYHINGDADDADTSGKENTLEAMIASDPDKVTEFFTGLTKNLYDSLTKNMSRVEGMRSYMHVYNDVQMKEQYNEYKEKIEKQQEAIDTFMDRWYDKFTAMETALAKINSYSSSISSILGM